MKKILSIYNQNKFNIEYYIENMLKNFDLTSMEINSLKYILNNDKALQLIYFVNQEYKQITHSIWKNKIDETKLGVDKSYYFKTISCQENCMHISNPYIHYETGRLTITFSKKIENNYVVLDIDLITLLEELHYINDNSFLKNINTIIVTFSGTVLSLISLFLIVYGLYIFCSAFFQEILEPREIMHTVFSSIISLTIGVAIYDLSKTLIENEIIFRKLNQEPKNSEVLTKFLNSIIITLSIESLMIVFKIVLNDYSQMIYAFYLILGITLLILSSGIYSYLTNKK